MRPVDRRHEVEVLFERLLIERLGRLTRTAGIVRLTRIGDPHATVRKRGRVAQDKRQIGERIFFVEQLLEIGAGEDPPQIDEVRHLGGGRTVAVGTTARVETAGTTGIAADAPGAGIGPLEIGTHPVDDPVFEVARRQLLPLRPTDALVARDAGIAGDDERVVDLRQIVSEARRVDRGKCSRRRIRLVDLSDDPHVCGPQQAAQLLVAVLRLHPRSVANGDFVRGHVRHVRHGLQDGPLETGNESAERLVRAAFVTRLVRASQDVFEQRQRDAGLMKGHLTEVANHLTLDGNLGDDRLPHQLELLRQRGGAGSAGELVADGLPRIEDFRDELLGLAIAALAHVGGQGESLAQHVVAERDGVQPAGQHDRTRIGRRVGRVLHPQFVVDLPSHVDDLDHQDRKHEDGKHRQRRDRSPLITVQAGEEGLRVEG